VVRGSKDQNKRNFTQEKMIGLVGLETKELVRADFAMKAHRYSIAGSLSDNR
jgi:hypothetical protein